MKLLESKLASLEQKILNREKTKIAIFGLGSVGNFLLTFLLSHLENIEVFVVGRKFEKMLPDVNISRVSASLRHNQNISVKIIEADFANSNQIASVLLSVKPDFIVNSSRAYSHIKYGSLSWNSIRAYGIWSPLSVMYIKNIMEGIRLSGLSPIVINTSYSDVTNVWLRTSGSLYPDFGSGNLNHLIPRIKFALGDLYGIPDIENIDVTLATSHFHDVVISKEGITDGIEPLLNVNYQGKKLLINYANVFSKCAIPMPTDEKRNMMNASSNFEIIFKILNSIKVHAKSKFHSPGFCGLIGGYPIVIDFTSNASNKVRLFEDFFSLELMEEANKKSIYLDGIESISEGILTYSDEVIEKTKKAFKYELPKSITLLNSDFYAKEIITNIIEKFRN